MTQITIDAGTLEFGGEDLTASGLLIPFGVKARSNIGEFTFAAGDVRIPTDLGGMSLNVEHKREHVVGAPTRVWEQPEGIFAAFKWRDDEAGRAAYADAKSGKRRHLSAEVAGVKIRDGRALPGSLLFAAGQVERPAFEGATLLAALDTPLDAEPSQLPEPTFGPDENGRLEILSSSIPTEIHVSTPAGDSADFTPASTPEPANPEGGSTVTASATPIEASAAVTHPIPSTLLASAPVAGEDSVIDLGSIFAAMSLLKRGQRDESAETLLAELSDIKYNATGGLTTANGGVLQPAWVGRLWQGKRYARKWMELFTHTYGGIQLGGRKGFKINQGSALVTRWAGNKTPIGSGTATTSTVPSTLQPYGYAADVAREWYDLEGGAEVLAAFFEGVVDSYAEVTDADALAAIFLAASRSSAALDRVIAPDADIPTDFPEALGIVIQAIEEVSDNGDDPTSVIVNPKAWKQLLFTPKDKIPEYVTFAINAGGENSTANNGKVTIRKAPASTFAGMNPAEPAALAGAPRALEFRELGTTPIQIDALDIAKGGIDKAVIGYVETLVVRPESLALVGTKSA